MALTSPASSTAITGRKSHSVRSGAPRRGPDGAGRCTVESTVFTLVACLVVVGLSAAATRWQAHVGGPQPATERARAHRQRGVGRGSRLAPALLAFAAPASGGDGATTWLPTPSASPQPEPQPRPAPPVTTAPPRRTAWRRLRAAASLLAVVIVIGVLVAAVVGAIAAFTAFSLREAVK